jgi:hypothetical protein
MRNEKHCRYTGSDPEHRVRAGDVFFPLGEYQKIQAVLGDPRSP